MILARLAAAVLSFTAGAPPTPPPYAPAIRLDYNQLVDNTNPTVNDRPLHLLAETYTPTELAAAGPVTIRFSTDVNAHWGIATLNQPPTHPDCPHTGTCILIDETWWTIDWPAAVDINRVEIAHEYGHALTFAWQTATGATLAPVGAECLADAIAANVLARGGWPGLTTDTYSAHYPCDNVTDPATVMAADVLAWTDNW